MSSQWADGLRKRLAYGLLSNFFSKAVTTLSQLIGVPIFLHFWGVKLYGEWILLNTIPTYLGLSDMGFGSAAGNEMTILEAQGKRDEVITTFQSVWLLLTAISLIVGVVVFLVVPVIPLAHWLGFTQMTSRDTTIVTLLLTVVLVLSMQEQLFQCAFRCVGKYAYGTSIKAAIQFLSFVGLAIAVALRANVIDAAIAYAAVNCCGTLAIWLLLRREIPWIRLGWKYARFSVIRSLASAAFSFMGLPVSYAISLQGILFVVNANLGAAGVVVFGVTRAASRFALQMLLTINNAVWPELSAAYGAGDLPLTRRLHRRACQAAFAISWLIVLFTVVAGPWVIRVWTHKDVVPSRTLLLLMLAVVVIQSFWMTSATLLYAINRHQKLSVLYLLGTSASLLLAIYLTRIAGVDGAALSMVVSELVMVLYVLPATLGLVEDTPREFFLAMFQPVQGFGLQQVAKTLGYRPVRRLP
ncbi:MAG TPA: lipopolysaccharide biosynthesis protein [Acidobacteriaceae bacterium]|jgi:O-antigen/teichoic acid export membrane protein|nr:lipopolysaccharide biosynthesis protein [Acidobacteriaceae bacterium]